MDAENMQQQNVDMEHEEIFNERSLLGQATIDNATLLNHIDRVNKMVNTYQWDKKFVLFAIYTRLKGPTKR